MNKKTTSGGWRPISMANAINSAICAILGHKYIVLNDADDKGEKVAKHFKISGDVKFCTRCQFVNCESLEVPKGRVK